MAKARFLYTNLATAAATTITASASATGRPASFLSNVARWKKWRSTTTTGDQNVVFDFLSSFTVKGVVLVDWKRHAGGTIKAEYWTGAAWAAFGGGTGLFTLPAFNPTKVVALWFAAGQSTAKIRIYFTNTGAVSDYVELGVAAIGDYYQPTYNIIDGFSLERVDPSLIVAAVDGQEEAQSRTPFHVAEGVFEVEPEADFDAFRTLFDAVGARRPFIFAIEPDDPDEILYCRLRALPIRHDFGDYWTINVAVQEVR